MFQIDKLLREAKHVRSRNCLAALYLASLLTFVFTRDAEATLVMACFTVLFVWVLGTFQVDMIRKIQNLKR